MDFDYREEYLQGRADLMGMEGKGGEGGGGTPTIFYNHLTFAVTLKNYKLCYLKLNWSLVVHL